MALRVPAALAVALAATAALSACSTSPAPTPAPSAASPSPTSIASTTTTAPAMRLVGGPLTATDLHGWQDSAVPAGLSGDWVRACGKGTGVAALQSGVKTQALTAPGGVQVVTRTATYAPGKVLAALSGAEQLFTDCPVQDLGASGQVTVALMDAPAGQQAVGALVTTINGAGVTTGTVGYWIVKVGDASVEVWARAQFIGQGSQDPMLTFSSALRDAAIAKALGQTVPGVPVPTIAAKAGAGSGSAADPTGVDPGVSGGSLTDPNAAGPDAAGGPDNSGTGTGDAGNTGPSSAGTGLGGESGPGVISGSETPEPAPAPLGK